MNWILQITFWTAVALIFYTYCGYPLLIRLVARGRSDARFGGDLGLEDRGESEAVPDVTVLIAAYNAAEHLDGRIDNLLACEYPGKRLRIVIASDGSTDDTVERVRRRDDCRVEVLEFAERRGKTATLAEAVPQIDAEVIVFTDATTYFQPDSLWRLTRHFADREIGIAVGEVGIVDGEGRPIEAFYWRQEMGMRRCEARLGILNGASGAIYAIRRSMFVAPPRPVINDDLVLPILARLKHRCPFVLDPSARAYVSYTGGLVQEFRRRCRIGAGAYQALAVLKPLLHPRHAKEAWAFGSRKVLRWLCPFLMVAAAAANLALLGSPLYDGLLAVQVAFYATAVIGLAVHGASPGARLLRLATSFSAMNLALLAGFFGYLFDSQKATWSPTPKEKVSDTFLAGLRAR